MRLSEIMTRDVEVIAPDAPLAEAARKMQELNVGSLPVCDGQRLVGMVTDRDITVRATSEGRDPTTTRVRDAMTGDITYCYEDQDVAEAARLMEQRQIRRLVVLDRNKRLVGIVSLGDLAVEAEDLEDDELAETLEQISEPAQPQR
jgi:CBS domain-containing protein